MEMKKISISLSLFKVKEKVIMFASLLLLASCAKDDDLGIEQPSDPQEIRFEMVHTTATASQAKGAPSTRVATDTEFNSTWQVGDKVGLYIVKGSGNLQASDNWVDNMLMEYNGTGWDYTLPTGKEYYPKDGDALNFYAYYPYDATLANPLDMTFTVQTDQSTAENFAKSYLLAAATPNVVNRSTPVQLAFSHKLAMVQVKLINGAEAWNVAPRPADVVTLKSRNPATSLNLATGTIAPSGAAADIIMYYNEGYWYTLIPAQDIEANNETLVFEWNKLNTLSYKPSAPLTLTDGEVKPLDITISIDIDDIDPNHVYSVGDAYPYKGFSKTGVVFQISNGGKNGKITSLTCAYEDGTGIWGPNNVKTDAVDKDNGRDNMEKVKALSPTFSDYLAFGWCAALGEAWYLPAINELAALYDQRDIIDQTLATNGWQTIILTGLHWSSSEHETITGRAYGLYFHTGQITTSEKYKDSYVRAVRAF